MQFFKWIARYYHYPIGEVVKTALPAGLTKKSGRRILLTETGKKLSELIETESKNTSWLPGLLDKGEISPHITGKLWATKDRRLFESWEEKGWFIISSELVGVSTKTRTETCCAISDNID